MIETMTRNPHKDARDLWALAAADFLHYVVKVASPVTILDHDDKILAAFLECYEAEAALNERIIGLLAELGELPQRPAYDLDLGYLNFTRADLLVERFAATAASDLEDLQAMRGLYEGCSELSERLVLYLIDDFIALRKEFMARSEELVKGTAAAQAAAEAAAAGREIEDVLEEEEATTDLGDVGEDYPWHNEDLSLDDRMELAKNGSVFDKLFAAMAQTDCTACGYDCEGYARAIADGEDADLTKCAPGEIETQETLESLVKG
jgi:hypothetical protein